VLNDIYVPRLWVSSLQAHKLIQIYTNTDYCLVAFCTWILITRHAQGHLYDFAEIVRTAEEAGFRVDKGEIRGEWAPSAGIDLDPYIH
jgi:hypothetical protein